MLRKIYTILSLVVGFLFFANAVHAQVEFKLELMPDNVTYRVIFKPNTTWTSPFNLTSSAQVTIKAPTGGFVVSGTTSLITNVSWSHNATYIAPIEDPNHDYFSFGLGSLGTLLFNYQQDVEMPVFSFTNTGNCTGLVELMAVGDPFYPPNSENGNVGNQVTIFGAGAGVNAWIGNYDIGGANCGGASTCEITGVMAQPASDCGADDGSITITANGSSTLEYRINNGVWQSSHVFNDLFTGNYNVETRLSDNSCITSFTNNPVLITEPIAPVVLNSIATITSDCDTNDGSIEIFGTGGTNSYQFSLNGLNWQSNSTFNNLATGAYPIWIRNNDETCAILGGSETITAPASPIISFISTTNPSSCGVSDGSITINASGGNGSLIYSTDGINFSASSTFSNLSSNNYGIFVANADGSCEVQGSDVVLVEPSELTITVSVNNPSACNVANGSITITASGGTGSYLYSIDNGLTWEVNNTFNSLGENNYVAAVKNTDNSCETTYANNPVSLDAPPCPGMCEVEYILELLPDGRYQVSVLPNVTWTGIQGLTSTAQVTVIVPTGGFTISNLTNLIPGVTFAHNATYIAPPENFFQDYFLFGLTSQSTQNISYQAGQKVPLFTFENSGTCTGNSIFLMDNDTDLFFPPNSLNANTGQQLTTIGSGPDAEICVSGQGVDCTTPMEDMDCLVAYQLELLSDGRYQVSLISDTTWIGPQAITSSAQVTIVSPANSLQITNFTNLITNALFVNNATYNAPPENPTRDYFLIGLTSNGTTTISYQTGQKVPLFTFENAGTCSGDSIYLMPIEGDPFAVPNSLNANSGQQLTTLGGGIDINLCIFGEAAPCVPCGPAMQDSDDDGICDNEENLNGSDPFNPCDPDINHPNCDFECPEYFDEELIIGNLNNGPVTVCANFPATDAHLYDIVVNQATYNQPITSCDNDTLIFYTYAFTVGQGNDGPYEVVSWEANGQTFSAASIASMDELATLMNTWDVGGNWTNTSNFAAISGGHENGVYGSMILKHIATQVNTFIQINVTFISTAAEIELNEAGTFEVIISDDNCADTVYVEIYAPEIEIIEENIPPDSSEWNYCLDLSELPGSDYNIMLCEAPENGTIEFENTCLTYFPNPEFNGVDTICIVVCSDADPTICDTTLINLEIQQYICEDIYGVDSLYLQGDNGEASLCIPIALTVSGTYDILVNQTPYTQPLTACAFDTLIFYTYSFVIGQGLDGPYEIVSWTVNGQTFSAPSVMTMTDLANQMNVWDPTGNWSNSPFFSAISGGSMNTNYGQMILRHIETGVSSTTQANQTYLATGSEINLSGLGWQEIIFGNQLTNCLDTIYVNIVETETESITEILPSNEEIIEICLNTDELPGEPTSITFCELPQNGTINSTSTDCITYSPTDNFIGEDEFCVVICDDSPAEGPFCDTTIVTIIVEPPTDTIQVTINPIDETEVCIEEVLQFPGTPLSGTICNENVNEVDAEIANSTCIALNPVDGFVGETEVCVIHCYETNNNIEVCDTTIIEIFVLPSTDTVEVLIDSFDPLDTCLHQFINLPGTVVSGLICDENTTEVDATLNGNCVSLTNAPGFLEGSSEICVVYCDDSNPMVCDTTILIVNVDIECPEVFAEDTVYITSNEYCMSLTPEDYDIYDIVLNGVPYTFPKVPCDEDNLVFYSYAFIFGQGALGPYEVVSWEVNGNIFSGTFQSMNDLAIAMSAFDSSAGWANNAGTLSFSNTPSPSTYGDMIIKHVATGIQSLMLPNTTAIAQGTLLQSLQNGLNEAIFIDSNTMCTDTLYIWVIDDSSETITEITEQETPTEEICLEVNHLPGDLTVIPCDFPNNGIVTFISDYCFTYNPNPDFAGLDDLCFIICSNVLDDNNQPICDTTYIEILVTPETDVISTEIIDDDTDPEICLDDVLNIDGTIVSSGICGENLDEVDFTVDNTSCVELNPIAGFVGNTEGCVYHCYDLNNNIICDTTIIQITVLPPTDTLEIQITNFDPEIICLDNSILQLAGNFSGGFICNENIAEVNATLNDNGCIILDPANMFTGSSEVCVVHCDNNNPTICDTTIILIEVVYPCEEIYEADTIFVNEPKICTPIIFSEIGIYDVVLNGFAYTFPPEPCNEDSLIYYTYSFTFGAGSAGPYEVQWTLNGITLNTVVQDMDELTDWMNQQSTGTGWVNNPATASVSNQLTNSDFGMMILTHVQTDIPAILLPNYTSVAYGSCIHLNEPGLYELVLENTTTGCIDTVYVWYVNNTADNIDVTTDYNTDATGICIDTTGLPGNIVLIEFCDEPENGEATFDGTCVNYNPDLGFSGLDQFCVVICDDTPAPDGPFCDTTYINIIVEEQNCPSIFDEDIYIINEIPNTGHGNFCLPIAVDDYDLYEIIVNNQAYNLPDQPCDFDTLVFYTYSFTVGGGNAGPYELSSWEVNGNNFSGTVQDMDELTALMNQFDPVGNWTNDPNTLSISGGSPNTNYGNMILTHVSTNIPAILLPNYTPIANGISISLPVGQNEVIFTNTENNCIYEITVIVEEYVAPIGVLVHSKVILQGAYELGTNVMNDALRQLPDFPMTEPYSTYNPMPGVFRFIHVGDGGGETIDPALLNITGADAIVDWVFLELHSAIDTAEIVATRAALLQRDGDIVDTDGISPVLFDVPNGDYFLAVRHRNHLGIMSAQALSLSSVVTSLDFTSILTQTYGGTNARKILTDGTPVMWGGDANSDGKLIFQGFNNDPDAVLFSVLLAPGNTGFDVNYILDEYAGSDTSMDGQIIYQGASNDVDFMIFFNVLENPESNFIINYVFSEKLP